jgi:hypothetical protein
MVGRRLIVAIGILLCAGCSGAADGKFHVSGTVTCGGSQIADGAIYFVAADSEAVLGFSKIVAGRYSAQVSGGRARVRITADRLVPGRKNAAGNPLIEQYIPSRFNDATELEAAVEGNCRLDWNLAAAG